VALDVVLLAPEIPTNTGSIGRLCVCLDARLHLIRPLGFSLAENQVRRAGLDYWKYVDLHVHESWQAFLEHAQPPGLVFASTKASRSLYDYRFSPGDALVFGNETSGLPAAFYELYRDRLVTIPMPGRHHRSHNLATAVSIVAYEAYRQLCCATPASTEGAA
jgi:tRNA (cytidine/uridine-2'-O-)-methyltransferase